MMNQVDFRKRSRDLATTIHELFVYWAGPHPIVRLGHLTLAGWVLAGVVGLCYKYTDDSLRANDTLLNKALGPEANDPHALLEVIRNPEQYQLSVYEGCDLAHEALVRLLDLQKPVFHQEVAKPQEEHTRIEGAAARMEGINKYQNVVIMGTPNRDPIPWAKPDECAWPLELLEFTPEGRLVSRQCYDGHYLNSSELETRFFDEKGNRINGDAYRKVLSNHK